MNIEIKEVIGPVKKAIKSQGDKARAQAKENKKKNLENFNLNTRYSEQYLAEANK